MNENNKSVNITDDELEDVTGGGLFDAFIQDKEKIWYLEDGKCPYCQKTTLFPRKLELIPGWSKHGSACFDVRCPNCERRFYYNSAFKAWGEE